MGKQQQQRGGGGAGAGGAFSVRMSAQEAQAVSVHLGLVTKRGQVFKSWKRRLMVLTPQALLYFKNQRSGRPQGSVLLGPVSSVGWAPAAVAKEGGAHQPMEVRVPGRDLFFFADLPEETARWVRHAHMRGHLYTPAT